MYVSVRTSDRRRNAGRLIQSLTKDLGGSAGGHGSMAGAKIPIGGRSQAEVKRLRREIMDRFRRFLRVDSVKGAPMI
ncbi:MAG: DHH family phosphoesterase [Myxococcota bacterium]